LTLERIAIPSPNYSSRGGAAVRLIVIHTAEGALTIESLGNYFASSSSGVSSHAGADDKPNTIGVYVRRADKAWTQGDANPYSVALELCGFAGWGPAEWDAHPVMLENCAKWIGEEAAAFGIPLRALSAGEAQGGAAGVCQHVDLGAAGGGHWDCGPGFPMARVLEMAGGAPGSAPSPTPPPAAGAGPPFPGVLLVNYHEGDGTATWQARMAERGWAIAVDDCYGNESEGICRQFQAEKGLAAVDGIVGPDTWAAAWVLPVT
jgi:hypothetical protein